MERRDLVIVRAGKQSVHPGWIDRRLEPRFDVLVAAYEPLENELLAGAAESLLIPGRKVAGWHELFRRRPDLLERYDRIALMDDDLRCGPDDIALSFELGRRHALSLWQPSLSWDSHFSYAVTLNNPLFELRFVNFIEMMCPFFSSDHLARSLPLFSLGLETGIDRAWCRLQRDPHRAYAIIDAVRVAHTRPVGLNKAQQGFTEYKHAYQTVVSAFEADLGIPFRGPVAYGGISAKGRPIDGRLAMAARCLVPVLGWSRSVNDGWFWRPMVDHLRHILLRPTDNEQIDLARISRIVRD